MPFIRKNSPVQTRKLQAPEVTPHVTADQGEPSASGASPTPGKDLTAIVREEYPDMVAPEVENYTELLADPGRLKEECFNYILAPSQRVISEVCEEERVKSRAPVDYDRMREKTQERFSDVAQLRVRLLLSDIDSPMARKHFSRQILAKLGGKFAGCIYGPCHAAIIIEDTLLSWDNTSLVVPERLSQEKQPKFISGLSQHGKLHQQALEAKTELKCSLGIQVDYEKQLEIFTSIACEKTMLIYDLVELIARYNRERKYDVLNLNCQHFVLDVLEVLKIEQSPQFTCSELQDDFRRVRRGQTLKCKRFRNHAELDRYVEGSIDTLDREQLESLRNLYSKFHSKRRGHEHSQCPEEDCGMDLVRLRISELTQHDFIFSGHYCN